MCKSISSGEFSHYHLNDSILRKRKTTTVALVQYNIGMSSSFRSFETKWNECRVDITVVVWFWFDDDGDVDEDGKMKK